MAVWGVNGLVPPTDEEGFHAFARSLPDPEIAEAIAAAEPLTPREALFTVRLHSRLPGVA